MMNGSRRNFSSNGHSGSLCTKGSRKQHMGWNTDAYVLVCLVKMIHTLLMTISELLICHAPYHSIKFTTHFPYNAGKYADLES